MTTDQLNKLKEISIAVKSNYQSLDVCEILNRIHYVTGRDYQKCIAGFKMMIAENLIAQEFILNKHQLPKLEKIIDVAFPLMQTLDAELVSAKETITLGVGAKHVSDGPPEDTDEEESVSENILKHLSANF